MRAKVKLVQGVGINDSNYAVSQLVNGKLLWCPYYVRWKEMLRRCYSAIEHERNPTYIDCITCEDWKIFSRFKEWMITKDWNGKQLDKDLLIQGNKMYSPKTCIFVSSKINTLLNNHKAKRGKYPQGVCFSGRAKKFIAQIRIDNKVIHLGCYSTSILASEAYNIAKYKVIKDLALKQTEPLRSALLNYKITQ